MPALTVSVADMVGALERAAGAQVSGLIDWVPGPVVAGMVASWRARFWSGRAARLGLIPDRDFDSVIRMRLAESAAAVSG
jgi:D-erythronate 2-dehydrogenase